MPIQAPGQTEKKYAYSVTFKAVLPEKQAGFLMSVVKEHRVTAHVKRIEGD